MFVERWTVHSGSSFVFRILYILEFFINFDLVKERNNDKVYCSMFRSKLGGIDNECGDNRYTDGEVSSWENFFDPVLEQFSEETDLFWKTNEQSHCFCPLGEPLG